MAERNWKPRSRFRSSPASCSARSGVPCSSASLQRCTRSRSFSSSADFALLEILLDALEPALGDAEVRENQLVLHRLRIARGIDRTRRVRDRRDRETRERRARARRRSCSRRHRRAPARPPRAGGDDVGELDRRRHPFLRVVHRGQLVEPCVGDFGDADIHVAFAARRLVHAGHQLKESGFSAGGKANQRRAQHEFLLSTRPSWSEPTRTTRGP